MGVKPVIFLIDDVFFPIGVSELWFGRIFS